MKAVWLMTQYGYCPGVQTIPNKRDDLTNPVSGSSTKAQFMCLGDELCLIPKTSSVYFLVSSPPHKLPAVVLYEGREVTLKIDRAL